MNVYNNNNNEKQNELVQHMIRSLCNKNELAGQLLHRGAAEIVSRWRSTTAILLMLLIGVNEIDGHRRSCEG